MAAAQSYVQTTNLGWARRKAAVKKPTAKKAALVHSCCGNLNFSYYILLRWHESKDGWSLAP